MLEHFRAGVLEHLVRAVEVVPHGQHPLVGDAVAQPRVHRVLRAAFEHGNADRERFGDAQSAFGRGAADLLLIGEFALAVRQPDAAREIDLLLRFDTIIQS